MTGVVFSSHLYKQLVVLYACALSLPLLVTFLARKGTALVQQTDSNVRQLAPTTEENTSGVNHTYSTPIKAVPAMAPLSRYVMRIFFFNLVVSVVFCWALLAHVLENHGGHESGGEDSRDNFLFANDLFYYTNTRCRPYEKYESMDDAKKRNSYRYHQYIDSYSVSSSTITNDDGDLVIIYHTSDWSNMLTPENLISACQVEKDLELLYSECANTTSFSSVLGVIFDENCLFTSTTFNSTLAYLTLAGNKRYVEDSISTSGQEDIISSRILISYFPPCFIQSTDPSRMHSLVETVTQTSAVGITFARTDFLASSFDTARRTDTALCLFCCLVSSIMVAVFIANKLAVVMLLFCVFLSVILAIGFTQHVYGYSRLSLYSLAVVPVFTLLSVLSAFAFSHSWEAALQRGKSNEVERQRNRGKNCDARHANHQELLLDLVLCEALHSTCSMVHCFMGATLVVALSISLSPIISFSQVGKVLSTCLICFWVLYHLLVIPAFVVYAMVFPDYRNCCFYAVSPLKLKFERRVREEDELDLDLQEREQLGQASLDGEEDEERGGEHTDTMTEVDPEESRDVVGPSLRVTTPPTSSARSSSSSRPPPSPRSRPRSIPRQSRLRAADMPPLATDYLVRPHFNNYHDSEDEKKAADEEEDEEDDDDNNGLDFDFDDDISEFTKESSMYYSASFDAPPVFFQNENPAMDRALMEQGQRKELTEEIEQTEMDDNNINNNNEEEEEEEEEEEKEEKEAEGDEITEQNNENASLPHTLADEDSESEPAPISPPPLHSCETFCGKGVFGLLCCGSIVIFLVLVKFLIEYSITYVIFDKTDNISNFMMIGILFKTSFYSFVGSYGNLYVPPPLTYGAGVDSVVIDSLHAIENMTSRGDRVSSFEVAVCYGLGSRRQEGGAARDSLPVAQFYPEEFGAHLLVDEGEEERGLEGLLADMQRLCAHVMNHTQELSLPPPPQVQAQCLYTQLMEVRNNASLLAMDNSSSRNESVLTLSETIYDWMMLEERSRQERVGVVRLAAGSSGNFGMEYNLTWLCESFTGRVEGAADTHPRNYYVSHPVFTQTMSYRWHAAVESAVGDDAAVGYAKLPVLVSSASWMPVEVERIIQLHFTYAIFCIVVGTFCILLLFFRDGKLAVVIEVSSMFLTLLTLLFHSLVFKEGATAVLTLMDVTGLCLLFGLVMQALIFFASAMASVHSDKGSHRDKYARFSPYVRCMLLPLTTVGVSVFLLFAKTSLLCLLAEYMLVCCLVSCLYVPCVLPLLVRLAANTVANPVSKYFQPLRSKGSKSIVEVDEEEGRDDALLSIANANTCVIGDGNSFGDNDNEVALEDIYL